MHSSFGAQPNETNNTYQYGHAAWNTTVPQPTLTVAQTLGGTTTSVPPSPTGHTWYTGGHTPSATNHNVTIPSTVAGGLRSCVLHNKHGTPCDFYSVEGGLADFARHILNTHIGVELKQIHLQQLKSGDAQLLCTKERVQRAEDYAWRCPVAGCYMGMRDDIVRRHSETRHPHAPVLALQLGKRLETGAWSIVQDILNN
jgi:hypothetical protein